MHIIAPSVLAANFLNLEKDIDMINNSLAQWIHLDVMDGVFVPNISYGMPVIKAINKASNKVLDVHLMIVEPDRYITDFKECGADVLTVHLEACKHLHRTVSEIKKQGMLAGVAINPHTPIHLLEDIIADVDLLLIMSVNPGFGGQQFIENTYAKVSKAKDLIIQKNSNAKIEVDGGVGLNNYQQLVKAGADVLVAGSAIFTTSQPAETIKSMLSL